MTDPTYQALRESHDRLLAAVKSLGEFDIVCGACNHRLTPGAGQVVGMVSHWAVTNGEKPAHKLRSDIATLKEAITAAEKLQEG